MKKTILNPEDIKIALIGKLTNAELFDEYKSDGKIRCQTSIWRPDRGKYPNFSIELIIGLTNAKTGNRWITVF